MKSLTLLEASQLVKQIESTFGVDASSGGGGGGMGGGGGSAVSDEPEVEVKTEFDVHLKSYPPEKKISVLKVVRSVTTLGLKEAKALVESFPVNIREKLSKDEAETIAKKLEAEGAVVELK